MLSLSKNHKTLLELTQKSVGFVQNPNIGVELTQPNKKPSPGMRVKSIRLMVHIEAHEANTSVGAWVSGHGLGARRDDDRANIKLCRYGLVKSLAKQANALTRAVKVWDGLESRPSEPCLRQTEKQWPSWIFGSKDQNRVFDHFPFNFLKKSTSLFWFL